MKPKATLRLLLLMLGLLALTAFIAGCGGRVEAQAPAAVALDTVLPPQQAPDSGLEGVAWALVSYRNADGDMTDVLADSPITMTFEDGNASGSAGCNRYFAAYQVQDENLTFGDVAMTRMMCPDPVMEQEQAFSQDLAQVASFQVAEGELTLLDANGDPILVFAAPVQAVGATQPSLVGPVWQWQKVQYSNDAEITVDDPSKYTIQFDEDGSVTVKADCKTAVGEYTDDNGVLTINLGPTTLQYCGDDSLSDKFLTELGNVAGYVFDGDRLVLNLKMDGGNLYFLPEQPATGPQPTETPQPEPTAAPEPTVTPAAGPAPSDEMKAFAGEYKVIVPPAEADGMIIVITLNLNEDGSLTLDIDDLGAGESESYEGAWTAADGVVTASVEVDGKTEIFTMTVDEDGNLVVEGEDFALTHIDQDIPLHKQLPIPVDLSQKAYVTLDIQADNPLDPFIVSVNGGGSLDASALGGDCRGYVNIQPVARINWQGEAEMSRVFFYSDHDPTLIVQSPDGEFHCNDDANVLLLDPSITFQNPEPGVYNIWVGSYYPDQLIPGVLVVTTREDVRVETFTLDGLIKRGPIAAVTEAPGGRAVQELVDAITNQKKDVKTLKPDKAITTRVTANGDIPAFEFDIEGQICNGFIKGTPDLAFDWKGDADQLNVFFEGDGDSTLLVVTPEGRVLCNDDASAENMNPLVTLDSPETGRYAVFVGRVSPEAPVKGKLTVTTEADAGPEASAKE